MVRPGTDVGVVDARIDAELDFLLSGAQTQIRVIVVDDAGGEIVAAALDLADAAVDVEVGAGEVGRQPPAVVVVGQVVGADQGTWTIFVPTILRKRGSRIA